eukprot:5120623-Prymnesium_polylepis.1
MVWRAPRHLVPWAPCRVARPHRGAAERAPSEMRHKACGSLQAGSGHAPWGCRGAGSSTQCY